MEYRGLTTSEAAAKLVEYGPNTLPEPARATILARFLGQFRSPLIYLLLAALIFDFVVWIHEGASGFPLESMAIGAILFLNAALGTLQEFRAERALKEIGELAAPHSSVLRDRRFVTIPSSQIVPGDLVRIEAGDRVPADGTLLSTEGLRIDESVLTGESVPVDRELGEMVSSGTLVVRGKALVGVQTTGPKSMLGRLATAVESIDDSQTPLEKRLRHFGTKVAMWVGALAVFVAALGIGLEGISEADRVIMFAVALAVAAVPEGLPAVLTLTLALGVQRMASRKAVVRRMAAVEALGSVTVIATDKTGTLTENAMVVKSLDCEDQDMAILASILANDAESDGSAGDPLDLAFVRLAAERGFDVQSLRAKHSIVHKRPFDSEWKYELVKTADGGTYVKGAPEALFELCQLSEEDRSKWAARVEHQAENGYRVLGLAAGSESQGGTRQFLGIVLLWDPPRAEVPDAIRHAVEAGIRVAMITGDHPGTASAVSRAVGISSDSVMLGSEFAGLSEAGRIEAARSTSVFARVAPEQKLQIVETLQGLGEIVAVTGDGVNDAPALKKSDVGVAMGMRGSSVSREVSDLVLLDDNFATIVAAIEEGRSIYENIQKFLRFLFSTNVALVVLILGGALGSALLGLRDEFGHFLLPLTAVQLLWINFVADGPAALAMAFERNPGMMRLPPRPAGAPLLDRLSLSFIFETGALKAGVGLFILAYLHWRGAPPVYTISAVFLYESISQLLFAYPAKDLKAKSPANTVLFISVWASIGLQLSTVLIPGLRSPLGLTSLGGEAWVLVLITIAITHAAAMGITWFLRVRAGPDILSGRSPGA